MKWDVLIAGGGIGGAVLATLLTRAGKRVLIVEKELVPPPPGRPEILWPATVRLLRSLVSPGALDGDAMIPVTGLEFRQGSRCLARITEQVFRDAGIDPRSTDPSRTRQRLLESGGFELRRGVAVTGVLKDGGRVVGVRARHAAPSAVDDAGEFDLLADWAVGDDGVHSRIREGCGIAMQARPFPLDLWGVVRDAPASLPAGTARIWINRGPARSGLFGLGAISLPGGKVGVLAPTWRRVTEDSRAAERLKHTWQHFLSRTPGAAQMAGERAGTFPQGFFRFRRDWGHAERYGVPGALLIGDALHPVSPAAGQGANMSVADAAAVAAVFAEAHGASGAARDERILAEYERRRRLANERSIGFTRGAARMLSLPPAAVDLVLPTILRIVGLRPALLARVLPRIATAFVGDDGDTM